MYISDKHRDLIDEALHYLRSSNYSHGRLDRIDVALAEIEQPSAGRGVDG